MKEWVNFESSPLANQALIRLRGPVVQVYSQNFEVPYGPLLPKDIRRLEESEAPEWSEAMCLRGGGRRSLADVAAACLRSLTPRE